VVTVDAEPLTLATATLVAHRGPIDAAHARSLIDAAADAGFGGLEFWVKHHDSAVAGGMSSEAFFHYAADRGLSMTAAEMTDQWTTADRAAVAEANAHLLDVTARAGASAIQLVGRELPSLRDAAIGLGALCDLAAERGIAINLEFVPFTGVATIAIAAQVLEATDRDNLGICLDVWHWFRQPGGPDLDTLRAIGGDRIHMLQLDDATSQPADDLLVETMSGRRLPGDGAADIQGLLDVLDEIGATPAIVSEVYSAELAALAPADNARRQYAAARSALERHQPAGRR
jgi:sugar phosphate isomerase/epimerase